jgi:histidinol-phosphatase (PHP family)
MHYVRGIDIGSRRQSPTFFLGKRIEDALEIYFEEWRKAVESGLFDVMAHPDYFRKYLDLSHSMPISWEDYGSTVYEAIDSLKSHHVGIEVNPSGWKHGIRDVYPIGDFLEAANKAGVEKVTVGSDCHSWDSLGKNTLKAVERLEKAGYDYLCVFEGRRNRKIGLSDVV